MKIYLHVEILEPEFTLPLTLDVSDQRTVAEVKRHFVQTYNNKCGQSLDPDEFVLLTAKKKQLASSDAVISVCRSNTDLFLSNKKKGSDPHSSAVPKVAHRPAKTDPVDPPVPAKGTETSAQRPLPSSSGQEARAPPAAKSQESKWKRPPMPDIVVEPQRTADGWREQVSAEGKPRASGEGNAGGGERQRDGTEWQGDWSQAPNATGVNRGGGGVEKARADPPPRVPRVQGAREGDGEGAVQVTQWAKQSLELARSLKAKGSLRQACEAWRQILVVAPGQTECFEGLAEVAMSCGRFQEALGYWSQALAVSMPTEALLTNLGKAADALQDYSAALMFYNRAMELALAKDRTDPCASLQVLIGKTLYKNGSQDAAIQLYTNVLQKNESETAALVEYAKAYVDRQRPGEALRILLRVLVHTPNDKEARQLISSIVAAPQGLPTLYSELGDAASSGPALAFMATLIKDYGAVEASVAIYYKALEASPAMTTYALNLVHTLEVCDRYQEALDLSLRFCKEQQAMTVGDHYSNAEVAAKLEGVEDIGHLKYRFATHPEAHAGIQRTCMWQPNYGAVVRDRTDASPLPDAAKSTALPSPAAAAPAASEQKLPPYSADALDLLALHFTIVKILYVVGALALIPGIVEVIEPARRGWDMHLTTIRNEHAYYCCVAQLFASIPHPLPDRQKVIYMAGDSHSLSSAWQVITWKGVDTVLVPKLVTGLKCWHLRPESLFFPKNNFNNVMESIPPGSDVVFLFGEIDCREGILRAVEKGRYKDVEEGISATIGYYLTALGSLQRKKELKVFVQPVAPVLNETREVVKVFNRILKEMVSADASAFCFLDFFPKLLTADQASLHPDFEMDGTHMSPKYVRLIEEALNAMP